MSTMSDVAVNTVVVLVVGAAGMGIALEHMRFLQGGAVARQAGLLSLSSKERRQILSKLLNSEPYVSKETTDDAEYDLHQSKSNNASDSQPVQDDSDLEMGTLNHVSEYESESTVNDVDEAKSNMPTKGNEEDEVNETSPLSVENQDSETINADKGIDETAVLPTNETAVRATEEDLTEQEPKDDAQHKIICAICIADYEEGEIVATGTTCSHLFHTECLLNWLEKHDACPYCRKDMMTAEEMRSAADIVLSKGRLLEVAKGIPSKEDLAEDLASAAGATSTTLIGGNGEPAEIIEGTA